MAQYSGNAAYTSWDGVDVSAFWTGQTDFNMTNSPTDVSGGQNQTHEEWNAGMDSTDFSLELWYDDTQATRAAHIASLKPGTKAVLIHGPQGNTAGMVVHEQSCIIEKVVGPNTGQKKDVFSKFVLSLKGADTPVRNIYDDVFT